MWSHRSNQLEILDLGPPHYTLEEYSHCLDVLDRIGRWLGGDAATFSALKHIQEPLSILDVGCGGGFFTIKLAKKYPRAKVVGIDVNPLAIEYAQRQLTSMKNPPSNVVFEKRTQAELKEPTKSYDIVLSTLVCHHLNDEQIIDFLLQALRVAKQKVVINDLDRHPLAYYFFKWISPLFFRNRLVQNDGPLSILRAFKYRDWLRYVKSAGLSPSQYRIKWRWAFRWIIAIEELPYEND